MGTIESSSQLEIVQIKMSQLLRGRRVLISVENDLCDDDISKKIELSDGAELITCGNFWVSFGDFKNEK